MPIKLKVARSAKELDDVFKLRYDVYVKERDKFSEKRATSDGRIVDHFDALPGVANVVAYDGDTAIASFRVNKDSSVGLAPEKYFDFAAVRNRIEQSGKESDATPCIVSGSMLAIHKQWRHKRNVIFALFKKTTAVMSEMGATHVFGAASAETFSLYGRLGFNASAEEQWVESVGDKLIPMMAPFSKVFTWAFGKDKAVEKHFHPDSSHAEFDTLLLSPGEALFHQNDVAKYAYLIEKGGVSISKEVSNQKNLIVAQLGQGALFGELACDGELRSATATATMNTQVIAIEHCYVSDKLHGETGQTAKLWCSVETPDACSPAPLLPVNKGLLVERDPMIPELLCRLG